MPNTFFNSLNKDTKLTSTNYTLRTNLYIKNKLKCD